MELTSKIILKNSKNFSYLPLNEIILTNPFKISVKSYEQFFKLFLKISQNKAT